MQNALANRRVSLSEIAIDGGTSDYTDAIDWGGASVDSGETNPEGDMIIEYYFVPSGGLFGGLFPRLEWTDYEKQQVELAFSFHRLV